MCNGRLFSHHFACQHRRAIQQQQRLPRSKRKVFVAEIFDVGDALDIFALGAEVVLLHAVEENHAHEEQNNDARETYNQETAGGIAGEERRGKR